MTASIVTRPPVTATPQPFTVSPAIRAAFRLLENAAPGLGARWAARLWMTLPKPRPQSRPIERGTPFDVPVGAGAVSGQVWGVGPPVYLLHGWAGSGDQLAAFTGALVARGYRVVAFDAPSHGRSAPGRHGPRSSSIPEFVDALTAVVAVHGAPHAVIAHSMGAIAAAAAVHAGLTANRLALLAPMPSPLRQAGQLAAALGFGARTHSRLIARVERRVGARLSQFDMPALGRAGALPPAPPMLGAALPVVLCDGAALPAVLGDGGALPPAFGRIIATPTSLLPPTLLVHDRDDRYAPFDQTATIADAWPGSSLLATTGLGHLRLLRDPDVVARVVDFVAGGDDLTLGVRQLPA